MFILKSLFLWSAVVDKNKLKCVRKTERFSASDMLCSFILGLVAGLFLNGHRAVLVRSLTDAGGC